MIDNAFCPGLEVVVDGELAAFDGVGGRMRRGWMVKSVKGGKRDDLDVDVGAGERDVGRRNEAYVVATHGSLDVRFDRRKATVH